MRLGRDTGNKNVSIKSMSNKSSNTTLSRRLLETHNSRDATAVQVHS